MMSIAIWLYLAALTIQPGAEQGSTGLVVEVMHDATPLPGAKVTAGAVTATTTEAGTATLDVPPGPATVEISLEGFETETATVEVVEGQRARVAVELHAHLEEEIFVSATRSGKRLQDQPLRVEVLAREEIEEKLLMTPGDVAMLLNETSGLRVQVVSPSLGAANVRVQGLRGRYTQILADGLPLYGGQTGSIGLLQIPPMDLGQVEIIKGSASAFYGASALGGVINLVSRRPPEETQRELLLNRTTRGGTDGVLWVAASPGERWGVTLLGGAHDQRRQDVDGEGWVDIAGYTRGVLRPRLYWTGEQGRSVFVTLGGMAEDREGGTMPGRTVPDGTEFRESLTTRRFDGGVVARIPFGTRLFSVRGSATTQRHEHGFGEVFERDRHGTALAEASLTGAHGKHTWVLGAAIQSDRYRARDVGGFDYTHTVPGVFVQDDVAITATAIVSASARLDHHSTYGTFLSPRLSLLLRPSRWVIRASLGSGYTAPTALTEETEAVGLSRVLPLGELEPERAYNFSVDAGTTVGVMELNATVFGSRVEDPVAVVLGTGGLAVVNASGPTRTIGTEALARARWRDFVATATYTLTKSTEVEAAAERVEVPLTPRHVAGLVVAWEQHGRSRVGLEVYYTGAQRLEDDPYRSTSPRYVILGFLAERRFGPARVFLNAENLTGVRQTSHDPVVLPRRAESGRWTVDTWAPLEGRTLNGGVRLEF